MLNAPRTLTLDSDRRLPGVLAPAANPEPLWSPRDILAMMVGQLRHGPDGRKGPASPYDSVAS